MITTIFLQLEKNRQLSPENHSLYRVFSHRDYPIALFSPKQLYRQQLPLNRESLVAGEIPVVLSALKQLKIAPPPLNDYPTVLSPFFHRKIWKSSLGNLIKRLESETVIEPIFAKPATRRKQFNGQIFASSGDLGAIYQISQREAIFCSELVRWLSEYRVYFTGHRLVGICHYAGDPAVEIDRAVVLEAVERLETAGKSLAGYSLDFGALETGETALVEMNEGFALGNYGLSDESYADLILARWEELMRDRRTE